MAVFNAEIAGRFYAEFFFYLAIFLASLYLALQPNRNPWIVVLAVFAALFFVEMLFLLLSNVRKAGKAFVRVDRKNIAVADDKSTRTIAWKNIDSVLIAWFSKDKWLEWFFGLEPSILVKTKGGGKNEVELGIAPDFFKTQKILAEMQKLYPDKIRFA